MELESITVIRRDKCEVNRQAIEMERANRAAFVRRGRYLEYLTIGYNSLEGLIAIVAGLLAGSIALVGFGFDSVIEVTSGAAVLWRLHADIDKARRERVEAITLKIIGLCLSRLLFMSRTTPSYRWSIESHRKRACQESCSPSHHS